MGPLYSSTRQVYWVTMPMAAWLSWKVECGCPQGLYSPQTRIAFEIITNSLVWDVLSPFDASLERYPLQEALTHQSDRLTFTYLHNTLLIPVTQYVWEDTPLFGTENS